jgi:putative glycerol-1-phosphate prenyltransferase
LISRLKKSQFTYGVFSEIHPRFPNADAILFLSLISGRNPDYLIEHQVKAAAILRKNPTSISTGYMLIESGTETATTCEKTAPLGRNNLDLALATAQGEMGSN